MPSVAVIGSKVVQMLVVIFAFTNNIEEDMNTLVGEDWVLRFVLSLISFVFAYFCFVFFLAFFPLHELGYIFKL